MSGIVYGTLPENPARPKEKPSTGHPSPDVSRRADEVQVDQKSEETA